MQSMTGFGSCERIWRESPDKPGVTALIEIKSVNSRFLEVKVRQPMGPAVELALKKVVEQKLRRGRVDVSVRLERVQVDSSLEGSAQLEQLGIEPKQVEELLGALASIRGVAVSQDCAVGNATDLELLRFLLPSGNDKLAGLLVPSDFIEDVTRDALKQLSQMRAAEGEALQSTITGYVNELDSIRAQIETLVMGDAELVSARLSEKATTLCRELGSEGPTAERLAQEIALLVSRSDIAEELERISSHVAQARTALDKGHENGLGKFFDFLAQEFNREFTTIGSKARNSTASSAVLRGKGVIERLREQVQNVE